MTIGWRIYSSAHSVYKNIKMIWVFNLTMGCYASLRAPTL
jgi:hypothetical protein